jgi:hypothetical protein
MCLTGNLNKKHQRKGIANFLSLALYHPSHHTACSKGKHFISWFSCSSGTTIIKNFRTFSPDIIKI